MLLSPEPLVSPFFLRQKGKGPGLQSLGQTCGLASQEKAPLGASTNLCSSSLSSAVNEKLKCWMPHPSDQGIRPLETPAHSPWPCRHVSERRVHTDQGKHLAQKRGTCVGASIGAKQWTHPPAFTHTHTHAHKQCPLDSVDPTSAVANCLRPILETKNPQSTFSNTSVMTAAVIPGV